MKNIIKKLSFKKLGLAVVLMTSVNFTAYADGNTVLQLTVKDNQFSPSELIAPANKPITIELTNLDDTPAEFESKPLRVEKPIAAKGKVTIQIRAMEPGKYRFFDDTHGDKTEGYLIVQ